MMKVKILKLSSPTFWYHNRIGEELSVDYDLDSVGNPFVSIQTKHYIRSCDSVITELPESFCVRICEDRKKLEKYIKWLNKTYGSIYNGNHWDYYGYIQEHGFDSRNNPFGTEIHIDDMIKHIDYMESQLTVDMKHEFDLTTNEGRLAYAKKYYPIGTKVISLYHEGDLELIINSTNFEKARTNGIQVSAKKGDGTPTSILAVIYENGKWAEIVKEEFDLTTNEGRLAYAKKHYPIGTKYIPIPEFKKLGKICTSDIEPRLWGGVHIEGGEGVHIEGGEGFIYAYGKWAEIVKETNMETQKLSRKGLKEIHGVACPDWKNTLEEYGKRNPLEDYIELTQEEVNEIFKACNYEQKLIVSEHLKQDDGSVDITKFRRCEVTDVNGRSVIERRRGSEYGNKSFLLNGDYIWEIKTDSKGCLCLIPTYK